MWINRDAHRLVKRESHQWTWGCIYVGIHDGTEMSTRYFGSSHRWTKWPGEMWEEGRDMRCMWARTEATTRATTTDSGSFIAAVTETRISARRRGEDGEWTAESAYHHLSWRRCATKQEASSRWARSGNRDGGNEGDKITTPATTTASDNWTASVRRWELFRNICPQCEPWATRIGCIKSDLVTTTSTSSGRCGGFTSLVELVTRHLPVMYGSWLRRGSTSIRHMSRHRRGAENSTTKRWVMTTHPIRSICGMLWLWDCTRDLWAIKEFQQHRWLGETEG